MNELALKIEKPEFPENWDYEESVTMVKGITYKWKDLTIELANELFIAREMLSIPPEEAAKKHGTLVPRFTWTQYCEDIGSSRQVVNRWLACWFGKEIKQFNSLPLPEGNFDIIYADPPWQYDFSETESREIENQYPTMNVDEICNMDLPQTTDNCLLLLWATAPKLIEALNVIESWGFTYKTNGIWDKIKIGMGYWFRGKHELLLVATKGNFSPPEPENRIPSIYTEERLIHSKKPEYYYKWMKKSFPGCRIIELFQREELIKEKIEGLEGWGNE